MKYFSFSSGNRIRNLWRQHSRNLIIQYVVKEKWINLLNSIYPFLLFLHRITLGMVVSLIPLRGNELLSVSRTGNKTRR